MTLKYFENLTTEKSIKLFLLFGNVKQLLHFSKTMIILCSLPMNRFSKTINCREESLIRKNKKQREVSELIMETMI